MNPYNPIPLHCVCQPYISSNKPETTMYRCFLVLMSAPEVSGLEGLLGSSEILACVMYCSIAKASETLQDLWVLRFPSSPRALNKELLIRALTLFRESVAISYRSLSGLSLRCCHLLLYTGSRYYERSKSLHSSPSPSNCLPPFQFLHLVGTQDGTSPNPNYLLHQSDDR